MAASIRSISSSIILSRPSAWAESVRAGAAANCDQGTGPEVRGHRFQVGQDEFRLLAGRQQVGRAQQDKRRFAAVGDGEQGGEVGVRGNDRALLPGGVGQDRLVIGCEQTNVPDVGDVVPVQAEPGGNPR